LCLIWSTLVVFKDTNQSSALFIMISFLFSQRSVVNQLKSEMENLQQEIKAQLVCINTPCLFAYHFAVLVFYYAVIHSLALQVHVDTYLHF
jgi:hypothetical protein